jgi:glycosyltransferase involved in cell wall biosynthesis
LPIHHVRPSIDADLFHAGAATRQREICYMPRRGRRDADSVLELLRLRGMLQGWRVTPLDGLSHAQVAERLRSATIYLALSGQEGFGLPAAEAMACGNYVVGYHGYGGREFFDPAWSCAVDAGDVLAVARAVEEVIRHEQTEPGWCMARGRLASRFVLQTYSTEREAVDVPRVYAVLTGLRAEPLQQPAATH